MVKAIFRIEKFKNLGKLQSAINHNTRAIATPNADPKKEKLNRNILSEIFGQEEKLTPFETFKEKTKDFKIRSNAVYAVEILISASPEYFADGNPEKLEKWLTVQKNFIKENFPDCIQAVLHLDEAAGSPHLHVIDVPLNEKGKLDCRSKYGGAEKLREWQDKAGKAVKELGIQRGVKGSKAQHTTIKQFYEEINTGSKPVKNLPEPSLLELIPGTPAYKARAEQEQRREKLFNLYKKKATLYDRAKKEKQDALKTAEQTQKRLEQITSDPAYKQLKRTQLRDAGHDLNHNAQQSTVEQLKSTVSDLTQHNQHLQQAVTILGSWLDPQSPPKLVKAWEHMTPEEKTAYQIAWAEWQKREHEKTQQREKTIN